MLDTESSLVHVEVNSKGPTEVVNAQSDVVSHRSSVPRLLWIHLTDTRKTENNCFSLQEIKTDIYLTYRIESTKKSAYMFNENIVTSR